MDVENKRITDWAVQERCTDLAWIGENLHAFLPAAAAAYEDVDRGAIVIDTTSQPLSGSGHPFGYFSQVNLEEYDDEDIKRLIREYDRPVELVLELLKSDKRISSYYLRSQPGKKGGAS